MTPKSYNVDSSLLQDVLNYLVSRPYGEVHSLVPRLLDLNKQDVQVPVLVEAKEEDSHS